jgi:arylsulfatase A-like enzyme
LEISFPGPHPPYDPTPDWIDRYAETTFPPLPLEERERESQPPVFRPMARHQRRYYMANVSMIDAQVGAIRVALVRRGLLENTVVVFTTDHGHTLTDRFSVADPLELPGRQPGRDLALEDLPRDRGQR